MDAYCGVLFITYVINVFMFLYFSNFVFKKRSQSKV